VNKSGLTWGGVIAIGGKKTPFAYRGRPKGKNPRARSYYLGKIEGDRFSLQGRTSRNDGTLHWVGETAKTPGRQPNAGFDQGGKKLR